jgi:hypothetical protein
MRRDLDKFEITALGFAVVPERLDGYAVPVDEEAASEAYEAEAHYERNELEHEAFCHGAGLVALLFDGLRLVLGFGEFDVFHVVVVVGGGCSVFLANEVAGAFASIHDVKFFEGMS